MISSKSKQSSQVTGNAGLFHAAWELSRRGWHVVLTVRNARGADLLAVSPDELVVNPIQSKALSKKSDVPLGSNLDSLRSPWWIITLNAKSSDPICYILNLDEVKSLAGRDEKEGRVSFWLPFRKFAVEQFEEKWDRLETTMLTEVPPDEADLLGSALVPDEAFAVAFDAHGGNQPRNICRALREVARDWTDGLETFLVGAKRSGLNVNNARQEWYNGRKEI